MTNYLKWFSKDMRQNTMLKKRVQKGFKHEIEKKINTRDVTEEVLLPKLNLESEL